MTTRNRKKDIFAWLIKQSDSKLNRMSVFKSKSKSEGYHFAIRRIREKATNALTALLEGIDCTIPLTPPTSPTSQLQLYASIDLDSLIAEQGWFETIDDALTDCAELLNADSSVILESIASYKNDTKIIGFKRTYSSSGELESSKRICNTNDDEVVI